MPKEEEEGEECPWRGECCANRLGRGAGGESEAMLLVGVAVNCFIRCLPLHPGQVPSVVSVQIRG